MHVVSLPIRDYKGSLKAEAVDLIQELLKRVKQTPEEQFQSSGFGISASRAIHVTISVIPKAAGLSWEESCALHSGTNPVSNSPEFTAGRKEAERKESQRKEKVG